MLPSAALLAQQWAAGEPRQAGPAVAVLAASLALGVGVYLALRREGARARAAQRAFEQQISALDAQASWLQASRDEALEGAQHKGRFLASMSHELRTPLNAVLGMASLLRDTRLTEEQREYVATIEGGSQALLSLIGDILDFSKLEAGKLEPERILVDTHLLADQALALVGAQAHSKGLELHYAPSPDVPTRLVTDPARLQQILVNLLSNAVKFTERGEVILALTVGAGGEVCFSVRDTGIGIPAEKLPLLFKPFSQLDASITRRYGGTGLGLAISGTLVELLGGRLTVQSAPGEGSTFSFSLPAAGQRGAPVRVSLLPDDPGLLVYCDASETSRRIVGGTLEASGIQARVCASAGELLSLLGGGQAIKAILLDPQCPPFEAIDLLATLAEQPLPPVVLLYPRGARDRGQIETFFNARFTEPGSSIVYKPVRPRLLISAVAAACRSNVSQRMRAPRPASGPARKTRVLVAEDNTVNQRVISRMLEKLGYEALVVEHGQLALEALDRGLFDIVILDVHMPVMDGLETARRIVRAFPEGGRPRIVGLTASALPGDRELCLAAGMDLYLTKPIQLPELAQALCDAEVIPQAAPEASPDDPLSAVTNTPVPAAGTAAHSGRRAS